MTKLDKSAAVGLLVSLALGACSCSERPAPPRAKPQHVLLLVIDTLRADHLSAWGHERPTSPHLDALAARGVRFARAASQCSWTSPSMVSLMTGRYLAEDRLGIPEDVATLAEVFQSAGYATAAFISNPMLSEEAGFHRGFGQVLHTGPYQADGPMVSWVEGQAGAPTFTYVHLTEPHDPYLSPPGTGVWIDDPPPLPAERLALYRELAPELVDEAGLDEIRRSIAGYDDDILYCDQRVEALVDALERTAQFETSAIVVTSDHGEGLWTRLDYFNGVRGERQRKGEDPTLTTSFKMTHGNQVYTELVHVPLILVAPEAIDTPAGGRVFEAWVENVDIGPTLLELCDLPDPGGLQGASLLRALDDPGDWAERKPVVYSATRFVTTVISQEGWQLVVPTPLGECQEGLVLELYDLNTDPEARLDLAAGHPGRVAALLELARARHDSGLPGHVEPSAADLQRLDDLGYADNGILEQVLAEFAEQTTVELLEHLADPEQGCLSRLQAARALAAREHSADEAARLDEILATETSVAIRSAFGR